MQFRYKAESQEPCCDVITLLNCVLFEFLEKLALEMELLSSPSESSMFSSVLQSLLSRDGLALFPVAGGKKTAKQPTGRDTVPLTRK